MSDDSFESVSFAGKKVLVRVDFNVPLDKEGNITDDARMRAALPTINKVLTDGGSLILMSHLGRPKSGPEEKFSLMHIVAHLSKITGVDVKFANNCIGNEATEMSASLKSGDILLLENLRFHSEEKSGDLNFAKKLADLGDVYINDAFGTAHRAHASTAVIAQFFPESKYLGRIIETELSFANKVLQNPSKPFTAIVGGAKVSDKLLILENLMDIADTILIGGGMSYTFIKAQRGSIGDSLCEDERMDLCLSLLEMAREKGVQLLLPEDSVVADRFAADANTKTQPSNLIDKGWMALDIGPKAIEQYGNIIANSKTVLWNGPMGVFEMKAFAKGTKATALKVAECTENGGFTLIGGGDSASAIKQFGLIDQVTHVSTGGGALLEYFEGKQLPGIAAVMA
jgi:phosphoglycerate kinase